MHGYKIPLLINWRVQKRGRRSLVGQLRVVLEIRMESRILAGRRILNGKESLSEEGAGLVYYYDREKRRRIEGINSASNTVKQGPSVGKAVIGGPFNLIDHNGK
ncbi:hypothetical protein ACS0TY_016400 [Phlomoides rotata]